MLLLVHHGDAVGPAVDPMRPLSDRGVAASTALAGKTAARGVRPDLIWHSGKIRALQTARIFQRACNPQAALAAVHGLQPGDPPRWIRDELIGDTRSILIVGHMPHLPGLLALLCPLEGTAPAFPLHGCVALEPDGNLWREIWRLEEGAIPSVP
jgi:phosphohistidine phosphatase